jgi:choline-sulfatase
VKPRNLLILMSDEHNPKIMGCAGNTSSQRRTSTRWRARDALHVRVHDVPDLRARRARVRGRQVRAPDRLLGQRRRYDGAIPSWHHRLRERGHEVVSIGKLHFRGAPGRRSRLHHGRSCRCTSSKRSATSRAWCASKSRCARAATRWPGWPVPGESHYTVYDRDIAARAQVWLHEAAKREHDKPWVLFVSFVAPHFPLTAPPECTTAISTATCRGRSSTTPPCGLIIRTPTTTARVVDYDTHFKGPDDVKRALAGYYG